MYSLGKLTEMCGGNLIGDENLFADWLPLYDSRLLSQPENTIFFALSTQYNDGHAYIPGLLAKGVKVFVTDLNFVTAELSANFIKVESPLKALQDMAASHRKNFNIPVIGITGSNGKTIVKEWLVQLLDEHHDICYSPKSFNSQLGVPLSVWPLNEKNDLAIFEAGISKAGEMDSLQAIISPTIGILTHLGPAHNQGFDSPDDKLDEKLKLFEKSEMLLTQHIERVLERYKGNIQTFAYDNPKADLNITSKLIHGKTTEIVGEYKGRPIAFQIPFSDEASIENACLCALTCLYLENFHPKSFLELQAVSMRLELKKGIHNCLLVNDSYSNDLHSLGAALSFLDQQSVHKKKTAILSDIEESGLPPNLLYNNVKRLLSDKGIERLIGIGPEFSNARETFAAIECLFYSDTQSFLNTFNPFDFKDESILVKGARKYAFERITAKLQQESHGSVLEINLGAALNNLNAFKSRLSPEIMIMAMVKAFAYGSGTYEMAKLICHKVDYLAVAYTDEGVALRNNGIPTPIMVMNPEEESYDLLVKHKLEPVVFSIPQLKSTILHLKEYHPEHVLRVHLELDTGMHRLGFMKEDLDELLKLLTENKCIHLASIFSHLSASDESKHDDFTRKQFESLSSMAEQISKSIGYTPLKHISNTAAALRFNQDGLDMIRLGIGLYGIDPTGAFKDLLEPVFTFKTFISQIKTIEANDSVGYSRKAISSKQRRIAILGLGYADGLNRGLSNGNGGFYIKGKFAPITGNVCMDMCMVDVSDIACEAGDEAVLFGKEHPIERISEALNTIPYEILTSISQRVKRVYVSE